MGQQHSSRQNLQDSECSACSGSGNCSSVSGAPSGCNEQLDGHPSCCPHCERGGGSPDQSSASYSDVDCRSCEARSTSEASNSGNERYCCKTSKVDCLKQDLSSLAISQRCCCSTGDLCKKTSSVDRYVSALVSRGCWRANSSSGPSLERHRRRRGGWSSRFSSGDSPRRGIVSRDSTSRRCVCTAYRRVEEDDLVTGNGTVCRWTAAAVLAVGDSQHSHSGDRSDSEDPAVSAPVILVSLPSSGTTGMLDLARLERLTGADTNDPTVGIAGDMARQRRIGDAVDLSDGSHNYQRPHFQVVCGPNLRALLLSAAAPPLPFVPPPPPPPPTEPLPSTLPPLTRIHTQVDYIHCLVPDLRAITACAFYWGKMDRYEAERLLDGRPEGTFLLRDSAQEDHLFSVSFRKYGRSLHARIEHFDHRFSFDSHDPGVYAARTVTGLIEHYKDPACVMFFEPMLTWPLARSNPFTLQQLARATIASCTTYDGISELPLPPSLQAYLKEYHYRQRVRVTRFENIH